MLVAPFDEDSVPGRYLAEHGEGFFLLSVGTDRDYDWRDGILNWRVADLGKLNGACFQATKETKSLHDIALQRPAAAEFADSPLMKRLSAEVTRLGEEIRVLRDRFRAYCGGAKRKRD